MQITQQAHMAIVAGAMVAGAITGIAAPMVMPRMQASNASWTAIVAGAVGVNLLGHGASWIARWRVDAAEQVSMVLVQRLSRQIAATSTRATVAFGIGGLFGLGLTMSVFGPDAA